MGEPAEKRSVLMRGSLGKDGGVPKPSSAPKICESAAKTAIDEWRGGWDFKTHMQAQSYQCTQTTLAVLTFSPDDQIVPISNTQVQDLYRSREQWLQKDVVVL